MRMYSHATTIGVLLALQGGKTAFHALNVETRAELQPRRGRNGQIRISAMIRRVIRPSLLRARQERPQLRTVHGSALKQRFVDQLDKTRVLQRKFDFKAIEETVKPRL